MKFIFDFDDVLFNNTKQFKPHMYVCLEKAGVPRTVSEEYYKEAREKEFSLKNFITILLAHDPLSLKFQRGKEKVEEVYEEIMRECKNFINVQLTEMVKKLGRNNCFIVTNGEKQFQEDKIKNSGIASLFSEIYIVPNSKKEIIYDICNGNKNEKIIFIEDKIKFIEDLDFKKCPNLKIILYDEQGLEKLKAEIGQ